MEAFLPVGCHEEALRLQWSKVDLADDLDDEDRGIFHGDGGTLDDILLSTVVGLVLPRNESLELGLVGEVLRAVRCRAAGAAEDGCHVEWM